MIRDLRAIGKLLQRHLAERDGTTELWDLFDRHIHVATVHMPDIYFEGCRHDARSLARLTARTLARCENVPLGRTPFEGRSGFVTAVDEDWNDRAVLTHLLYARTAVLRDLLFVDYERNLWSTALSIELDELYRRIGPILHARATRTAGPPETWRSTRMAGPARAPSEIEPALQQLRGESLEVLVPKALELLNTPITRSALTHILAPHAIDEQLVQEERLSRRDLPLDLAMRAAIRETWLELDPVSRELGVALAQGEDWDSLLAREPRLLDVSTLVEALGAVSHTLVGRISSGVGSASATGGTADALVDRLAVLLVEMGGELEDPDQMGEEGVPEPLTRPIAPSARAESRRALRELLDEPTGAAALARAGRRFQAHRAGGLAAGELEDGWLLDDRNAASPPLDVEPRIAELGSIRALVPVRRRLSATSGEVVLSPAPSGGWQARWEGPGTVRIGQTTVANREWTWVGEIPSIVETLRGRELLSSA